MLFKRLRLQRLFEKIMINEAYSGMTPSAILQRFPQLEEWKDGLSYEEANKILQGVGCALFTEICKLNESATRTRRFGPSPCLNSEKIQLKQVDTFSGEYYIDKKTGRGEAMITINNDWEEGKIVTFESLIQTTNILIAGLIASKTKFEQPV